MNIRPMLQKDYEEITKLIIDELGYPNQNFEDVYKRLDIIAKSNNHKTFVAHINDTAVGFIGLCKIVTYEEDEHIRILTLAVSLKYQRQGIGKALLTSAEEYAEENHIKNMKVSCAFHRTTSHLFYEANGFVRSSFSFFKEL